MTKTKVGVIDVVCVALSLALMACGPKTPPDSPDKTDGQDGAKTTKDDGEDAGPSELAKLVERLNEAIQEGNEAEATAIIEEQTADLLVEAVSLLPEWEPAGDEYGLVDYLDWEKQEGVTYVLEDEDPEAGTATMVAQIDGLDEFEGEVTLVEVDGETQMDFMDFAAMRRDEVLSEGLAREKFIEIVDNVNRAIEELDSNTFQNSLTLDTLNAEIELLSYSTKKKSAWSLKGVLKRMKNLGYSYSVSGLDVDTGEAKVTITDDDGEVVLEGDVVFKTEVGMMRLHYAPLVQEKIDAAKAKLDAKKKKKKKK